MASYEIARDGARVIIWIDTPGLAKFPFTFDAGSEWAAKLLLSRIQNDLHNRVGVIRTSAYRKGWADKSHHISKQEWFSECINEAECRS